MIMITLNTQRFMALCYGLCAFDYVALFFKQSNSETCEVNTINVVYLLYGFFFICLHQIHITWIICIHISC